MVFRTAGFGRHGRPRDNEQNNGSVRALRRLIKLCMFISSSLQNNNVKSLHSLYLRQRKSWWEIFIFLLENDTCLHIFSLRWLKTVSLIFNTNSLMDQYYHTFSFVSLKMVSKKCPIIIAQQVVIIFPT